MKPVFLIVLLLALPFVVEAQEVQFQRDEHGKVQKIVVKTGSCISGDCVNGKGVYTFANGDRYEGDFKDAQPNGKGVSYDSRNRIIQKGRWIEGKYIGP